MAKEKQLDFFERYLSLWVAACIVIGVVFGKLFPGAVSILSKMEVSHVNLPIAVLIWLMIYPMMLKIDFSAILKVGDKPKGLFITLFVNWIVKPFSMAFLGWLFFKHVFIGLIGDQLANEYIAGTIILAAAPCTAMVFVWSYLTDGDPAYTLVQVAINDLIMLVLFAPIVMFLLGVSNIIVPKDVLFMSVFLYIVIPLGAGYLTRRIAIAGRGEEWFNRELLAPLKPVTIIALLITLVIIFAFQGEVILGNWFNIILIAVPITIQVYFNSSLAYGLSRWLKVPHSIAAPGALIGASNFFELAVAVTISLFGLTSGATLATVVGVLVEVPVMLSVCNFCNRTTHWFAPAACSVEIAEDKADMK
ncbi:MAG: ACR3 family arsenite efflux transporter [Negativicutes bacterium]|nr:ACR3 family arsenite efflux transporter [Negativicutes bacterium]MDR3590271.1 ACR3 family arsenite efflux transporter [Negativicutes bacterium]